MVSCNTFATLSKRVCEPKESCHLINHVKEFTNSIWKVGLLDCLQRQCKWIYFPYTNYWQLEFKSLIGFQSFEQIDAVFSFSSRKSCSNWTFTCIISQYHYTKFQVIPLPSTLVVRIMFDAVMVVQHGRRPLQDYHMSVFQRLLLLLTWLVNVTTKNDLGLSKRQLLRIGDVK